MRRYEPQEDRGLSDGCRKHGLHSVYSTAVLLNVFAFKNKGAAVHQPQPMLDTQLVFFIAVGEGLCYFLLRLS